MPGPDDAHRALAAARDHLRAAVHAAVDGGATAAAVAASTGLPFATIAEWAADPWPDPTTLDDEQLRDELRRAGAVRAAARATTSTVTAHLAACVRAANGRGWSERSLVEITGAQRTSIRAWGFKQAWNRRRP
jgi:hypothetical protein